MSSSHAREHQVFQDGGATPTTGNESSLPGVCLDCERFIQSCLERCKPETYDDSSLVLSVPSREPFERRQNLNEDEQARQEVRAAAESGCAICKLVWGYIKSTSSADCRLTLNVDVSRVDDLRLECWVKAGSTSRMRPFGVSKYDEIHLIDQVSYASSSQRHTGSSPCLELVKTWYEDCAQHHPSCPPISQGWYPKRLLKLDGSHARLIISAEEPPVGPYATLSHCWGREPFQMLTSDTLDEFQNGISIANFPPSFRDAMQVALFLGINYIWIDCFTIFQGDSEVSRRDFEEQSSVMHLVYTNGAINIGAASAANPFHGCFAPREAPGPCWSTFPNHTSATHMVYAAENLDADFGAILEQSPLYSRAWVLQERTLAGRMVHFTDSQLFWTCSSCSRSETTPTTSHQKAAVWNEDMKCSPGSVRLQPELDDDHKRLLFLWDKLVMRYSASILTYPYLDKEFAIRGIATKMAMLLGDTYLDGVLADTLPGSLLWLSIVYKSVRAQRSNRPLPSWNWMSMDGPVRYKNVRLHCVPGAAKLNTYYNVCLSKVLHGKIEAANTLMIIVGRLIPVQGHLPDKAARSGSVSRKDIDRNRLSCDGFEPDDHAEWSRAIQTRADLSVLLMSDDGGSAIDFMVLAKDNDGLFRRLGIVSVDRWASEGPWRSWIEAYWRGKAKIIIIR